MVSLPVYLFYLSSQWLVEDLVHAGILKNLENFASTAWILPDGKELVKVCETGAACIQFLLFSELTSSSPPESARASNSQNRSSSVLWSLCSFCKSLKKMARSWLRLAKKHTYGENNCVEKQLCLNDYFVSIRKALEITVKTMVLWFSECSEKEIIICLVSSSVMVC